MNHFSSKLNLTRLMTQDIKRLKHYTLSKRGSSGVDVLTVLASCLILIDELINRVQENQHNFLVFSKITRWWFLQTLNCLHNIMHSWFSYHVPASPYRQHILYIFTQTKRRPVLLLCAKMAQLHGHCLDHIIFNTS